MSGTKGHKSDGESELALSSKDEELVDKKVTQCQLYGRGLDITKAMKRRLRQSAKYPVGQCQPRWETQQIFSIT